MRIGELARLSGVAASRIRFYEEHQVLPRAERSGNGYRDYPKSAVKTLRLIDDAQRLGFSLSEIRTGLSEAAPRVPSRRAMVKALRVKLVSVEEHLNEVRARRREIVRLLRRLELPER